MRHILTTATAVEKLKHEAKQLGRQTGSSLNDARELVAQRAGYDHWKHVTVCETATRHLHQLVRELFDRQELRPLLTGDVTSVHSSAAGGVFAQTKDGRRPRVDETDGLTRHVLPRMLEVLQALDGNAAISKADIKVDGVELCLTAILPPVSNPCTWNISRREGVFEEARQALALNVRL